MALTYSEMIGLGAEAPAFDLPAANPAVDGITRATRSLDDFADAEALVVVFMCNHCPYVVHVEDALVEVANTYQERGVRFVGISANDAQQYPADSFENMARRAQEKAFPFPYLYDESQQVARAYDAVCTPDFFGFNKDLGLQYRGRLDESKREAVPGARRELYEAMVQIAETGEGPKEQIPSMGCTIKWRPQAE